MPHCIFLPPYVLMCSYHGCINIYSCMSSWIDPLIIIYSPLSLMIFFILKFLLSEIRITTPAFWFSSTWNIFFYPFTFHLYVSLGLKWVSCRQHIYGSHFSIHSVNLYLLVGALISIYM